MFHLEHGPLGVGDLVDHVGGDHGDGGHGHQDADDVGPSGEHVVHVLHWRVGEDVEHHHALSVTNNSPGQSTLSFQAVAATDRPVQPLT